jgi:hypothetical protein
MGGLCAEGQAQAWAFQSGIRQLSQPLNRTRIALHHASQRRRLNMMLALVLTLSVRRARLPLRCSASAAKPSFNSCNRLRFLAMGYVSLLNLQRQSPLYVRSMSELCGATDQFAQQQRADAASLPSMIDIYGILHRVPIGGTRVIGR